MLIHVQAESALALPRCEKEGLTVFMLCAVAVFSGGLRSEQVLRACLCLSLCVRTRFSCDVLPQSVVHSVPTPMPFRSPAICGDTLYVSVGSHVVVDGIS